MRIFNIAGPCIPAEHFTLPSLERLPQIDRLIETKQFFVIHAARQTGKTTLLKALAHELENTGRYHAFYCSLESAQGLIDPKTGIEAIVNVMNYWIKWHPAFKDKQIPTTDTGAFTTAVTRFLSAISELSELPLVVLFDEADCLSDQTLITFLRQLRDGYVNRSAAPFPSSIALVGMRDIRDYKAKIRPQSDTLGSASPFNVITKSLTLDCFSCEDIESLYRQHTKETGQQFEKDALSRACYWTNGQPWLVNAIARECVEEILDRDYTKTVTADHVNQAAENILLRRDTHLDSLLERLKEERVRKVVEPVILGKENTDTSLLSR
jgi:hypothetical protein